MRSDLLVHVTACDISKGEPGHYNFCAVSRAVCRTLHKSTGRRYVGTTEDEVTINGKEYVPATKRDADKLNRFVNNFDNYRHLCRPTTIRLRLQEQEA